VTSPLQLCGIRLSRSGPICWADPVDHVLLPGALVVIQQGDQESLAVVVVGSGQLLGSEEPLAVSGRIIRVATAVDERAYGHLAAERLGLTEAMEAALRAQDEQVRIIDTWLEADGARLLLLLDRSVPRPDQAARELMAIAGLPVMLLAGDLAEAVPQPITGVGGAGMPPWLAGWLVPPGSQPTVIEEPPDSLAPPVGNFIDRLFPPADRPPARRRS
jgi:hypothetical protein